MLTMYWQWLNVCILLIFRVGGTRGLSIANDSLVEGNALKNVSYADYQYPPSVGPTVAVIGCGPSGMFFLHALAEKRKGLREEGDIEGLSRLPQVTVFERSSSPGGVWRNDRNKDRGAFAVDESCEQKQQSNGTSEEGAEDTKAEEFTNMYEGLWINGHKDGLEFFDHTFEEHFQSPQSVFLPRQKVLEYIMARVTKHENIFQDVQFDTSVQFVEYDEIIKQFVVTTTTKSGVTSIQHFDKCIWAAGVNGAPNMVPEILDKLSDYKGQIVHSSAMNKLVSPEKNAVKGRRILLIGDSSSAEDLALQTIKLGAENIYISSRENEGSASYTGEFPYCKVENLLHSQVAGVKQDGTGKTISFNRSKGHEANENLPALHDAEAIDIIIFCTGYEPNTLFLDEELMPWPESGEESTWTMEDLGINSSEWKMKENAITSIIGDVKPSKTLQANTIYLSEVAYKRQLLMANPNMMFLYEVSPYPLLELDIAARSCLSYITGQKPIPTKEEMAESNRRELLESMNENHIRFLMDENYNKAVSSSPVWMGDTKQLNALVKADLVETCEYEIRFLAREMNEANYPLRLGDIHTLDETGLKLFNMRITEGIARVELGEGEDESTHWKTIRDLDPKPFSSLFTGMGSAHLKGKWLELDDEGNAPADTPKEIFEAPILTPVMAEWIKADNASNPRQLAPGIVKAPLMEDWDEFERGCSSAGETHAQCTRI